MLAEQKCGSYTQYKADTSFIATWLVTNREKCSLAEKASKNGYVSFDPNEDEGEIQNAGNAHSNQPESSKWNKYSTEAALYHQGQGFRVNGSLNCNE